MILKLPELVAHPQGTDPLVQHGGRDLQSPTRGAVFSDVITKESLDKNKDLPRKQTKRCGRLSMRRSFFYGSYWFSTTMLVYWRVMADNKYWLMTIILYNGMFMVIWNVYHFKPTNKFKKDTNKSVGKILQF